MSRTRIIVASHAPYWMPADALYLPVHAGAASKETLPGFQRDDEGENISDRNARYSELTALYWAWKNLDAQYIGLAHYRRHFRGAGERGTLTSAEAERLLARAPVILPRKRNYYIETVESHYAHTADGEHIDILREVVAELAPEYSAALERRLAMRTTHICNMFVMRRDILDAYCAWLFPILDKVDARIDFASLPPYHARAVGRVAEYLLDVWVDTNGIAYVERSMRILGSRHLVGRVRAFLAAKFLGRKYDGNS